MAVYFISEITEGCFTIKIGVSSNIPTRLNTLQTGNSQELQLLGWIDTEDSFRLEKQLHKKFQSNRIRNEWFDIQPAAIQPILSRAGSDGFVATNADAFQIVGRDRDAVPEYLGV